MKSNITNSDIGSTHWFNSIMGNLFQIGEFMKKHEVKPEQRIVWGVLFMDIAREMTEWNKIAPAERIEALERKLLKELKEKYESKRQMEIFLSDEPLDLDYPL